MKEILTFVEDLVNNARKIHKYISVTAIQKADEIEEKTTVKIQKQEKAVREFADRNYKYMQSYKVLSFLGKKLDGKVANFSITISGMLAASHKEGGPMTAKYLKSLEKK